MQEREFVEVGGGPGRRHRTCKGPEEEQSQVLEGLRGANLLCVALGPE